MFEKFPVEIITKAMSEDLLFEQISHLKQISGLGVDWNLFHEILINAHNGMPTRMPLPQQERNSFDMPGWIQHYARQRHAIIVTEEQLQCIFIYLQHYHPMILMKKEYSYTLMNSPQISNFQIEFIVLKTLE